MQGRPCARHHNARLIGSTSVVLESAVPGVCRLGCANLGWGFPGLKRDEVALVKLDLRMHSQDVVFSISKPKLSRIRMSSRSSPNPLSIGVWRSNSLEGYLAVGSGAMPYKLINSDAGEEGVPSEQEFAGLGFPPP
jgi:hypothetical protein